MMVLRTLVVPMLGVALLAQPASAETTERHRAFRAWQAYCDDASRPKNDATVHYCDGLRFAAAFVPLSDASRVGAASPATMPDGRRAAVEMGRAPPPDGLPLMAASAANPGGLDRAERSEPSRATRVVLGGWIDAQ